MAAFLRLAAAVFAGLGGYRLGGLAAGHVASLKVAGGSGKLAPEQLLEDPVLLFAVFAAASCVAAVAFTPLLLVPCLAVSFVATHKAPAYFERRRKEELRASCERELAMMCDIVAMGIDAGLSFDAALDLYCQRFDNELSRRLAAMKNQWEHAVLTRSEGLERLARDVGSPAFRRFADTASRAVSQGAPFAGMLRSLAVELRQSRKTQVERDVARAPVKMLVPTGACILPAMLLLVMGPMLLQFMGH